MSIFWGSEHTRAYATYNILPSNPLTAYSSVRDLGLLFSLYVLLQTYVMTSDVLCPLFTLPYRLVCTPNKAFFQMTECTII